MLMAKMIGDEAEKHHQFVLMIFIQCPLRQCLQTPKPVIWLEDHSFEL